MADQQFPEPTVGVFIFNQRGELLLLQSHKWPGAYVVPGGHVELGERLEEAAIREAKEETGLDVYELEFINFQQFIYDPAFWKQRHFIFFDFAAKTMRTDVVLNKEAQEYVWVDPEPWQCVWKRNSGRQTNGLSMPLRLPGQAGSVGQGINHFHQLPMWCLTM